MQTLSLQTRAALHTALSPRLQKAVRLLQLSSLDFAQEVRDMAGMNPFLEHEEPEEGAEREAADFEERANPPAESWGTGSRSSGSSFREDEGGFDSLQAPSSLASHLLGQLNVLALSPRDRAVAEAVVGCLDDDGLLRMPLEDVAQALEAGEPPCGEEELRLALCRVQALDPAGVGARDVAECLCLQMQGVGSERLRALARELLHSHKAALLAGDVRVMARKLGCGVDEVETLLAALKRLDPHPGWRHSPPPVTYAVPDVIARKERGRWVAVLNDAVVPKLRVNQGYVQLFQRHRSDDNALLGAQLQEARWTVRNVEQRFSTILGVAQAVLQRQQHFLAYGPMAMKPLALKEIAEEVGVHESTVSRVTNNKFMATPSGVFELKYFFSRGLATVGGTACSPTAIRGLIGEIVAGEKGGKPLSDVEIARELQQQGLQVARRTVTKYRQLLRIAPVDRRRSSAG